MSSAVSFKPSDLGMQSGEEYEFELEVTSERFKDGAFVETVKSTTITTLSLVDSAPDVQITGTSPKDPLFLLQGQEASLVANNAETPVTQSRGSDIMRTLLPRGEGPDRTAKLVVRVTDEFGAYADAPLSAVVTLDSTDIAGALGAATKTLEIVNADGDVEASLSSLTTISRTDNTTALFSATEDLLRAFAGRAASCRGCGSGTQSKPGTRFSLTVAKVCLTGNEPKSLQSPPSAEGGSALSAAGLTLPAEVIERAKMSLKTGDADSAGIVLYHYLRNPYPEIRAPSGMGNRPESIAISATVLEASVLNVPVANLATPMRFEIPFPEGVTPAPPLDLLFFNTTTQAWSSCSNASLEQRAGPTGALVYYAIGTCDHLTAFSIGTAERRAGVVGGAGTSANSALAPSLTGEIGRSGDSASTVAIAVGVAVGGVALIVALAVGVWCLVAGRGRGRGHRSSTKKELEGQNAYPSNQGDLTAVHINIDEREPKNRRNRNDRDEDADFVLTL
eukprot:tig00020960_g16562.t1